MLEADNQFMRRHGIEAWLAMQQKRRLENYTYVEARGEYRGKRNL
jgi:hypothetical protein